MKKIGLYGWTLMITLMVVAISVIAGYVMFFSAPESEGRDLAGELTSMNAEDIDEETAEKIKEVQATIGKDHRNIGDYVSSTHEFYNDTTGYGAINHLNWIEQRNMADDILKKIGGFVESAKEENLIHDLEHIERLAKSVKEEENIEHVRNLHRYFHDLDIALNAYHDYRQVWNVTRTLSAK
ncbi:hypothetical protein [Radiobacillus deserti]|uniref:Uncharacterized protein n=1 Tax=Radiobacillus deserti TaxID=2594883 RepID=A0A516KEN8_9BACI|nr:hypothetical protein [Radiobacillus deserti]QDP39872.1 hypothetical protein FN924_06660 [Radiobacillus deserti]